MDQAIQKGIHNYFNILDGHVKKWNSIMDKLQRPLVGLKNQAEQMTHVERVNFNAELTQFQDLKDKLLFKILLGIEAELLILKTSISELNTLNQDLRNKLVIFDKSTADYDWYNDDAESGSAFQPRLSDLLQMAYESWKYYSDMYQSISTTMKSLDVRNNLSIEKLQYTLDTSSDVQNKINYVLALTQYCNKNS